LGFLIGVLISLFYTKLMQPSYLFYLVSFIFGSAFGSFLCVLIDRLSTGRSFISGRSYCEHCKRTLAPIDLIPVFSYLFLRGKCRNCRKKIPFRLFFVELLTGGIVVYVTWAVLQGLIPLLAGISLGIVLISFTGIFFADIIYGIIPDFFTTIILLFTFAYLYSVNASLLYHLLSGFGSLIFFLILFIATRGKGMGFGDVKL
jgi:prepilin signal peptidase PulO-like enzyme (type II secretory pathway)